jgi:hypothetical protein
MYAVSSVALNIQVRSTNSSARPPAGETYAQVAEQVMSDVLIEDNLESMGSLILHAAGDPFSDRQLQRCRVAVANGLRRASDNVIVTAIHEWCLTLREGHDLGFVVYRPSSQASCHKFAYESGAW